MEHHEHDYRKEYEFLDHTADAKFLAHGHTLEGAFSNAAKAMFSIVVEPDQLSSKVKHTIHVEGHDEKALLYNFLEELLFLLDKEFFGMKDVRSMEITHHETLVKLDAIVVGQRINDDIETGEHVKAITYNEMEIVRHEHPQKGVTVQVVLDL